MTSKFNNRIYPKGYENFFCNFRHKVEELFDEGFSV